MTSKNPPPDPGAPGLAHLAEAYRLYDADEFDAALAACNAALACLPMLAEAYNLRGVVLEELGREPEAIAAYREALQLEPDFAEPRENLRQIEAEQGHLAEAYRQWEGRNFPAGLAACDAALQNIPSSAEAQNLRGIFLEELGRPMEALQAYETAVRFDPNLADAVENLQGLRDEWDARFHLTTIMASDYPTNLHILKGRLEAEGIPAFIADEEVVTMNWLYATALGGVRLQVWRQDAERAAEILGLDWREEELRAEDDIEGEEEPAEGLALDRESGEGRETAAEESIESDLNAPLTLEELSTLAEGCTPDQGAVTTDSAPDDELIRCPECGSTNISYRKYRQCLVFGAWLLLGFPLPLTKRRWQCEACGHEWRAHP